MLSPSITHIERADLALPKTARAGATLRPGLASFDSPGDVGEFKVEIGLDLPGWPCAAISPS